MLFESEFKIKNSKFDWIRMNSSELTTKYSVISLVKLILQVEVSGKKASSFRHWNVLLGNSSTLWLLVYLTWGVVTLRDQWSLKSPVLINLNLSPIINGQLFVMRFPKLTNSLSVKKKIRLIGMVKTLPRKKQETLRHEWSKRGAGGRIIEEN